ncbi:MAG: hypothetical protein ACNS60_19685 [Candidatus Cyclobacteriaceae bacterium M2_1C_046]
MKLRFILFFVLMTFFFAEANAQSKKGKKKNRKDKNEQYDPFIQRDNSILPHKEEQKNTRSREKSKEHKKGFFARLFNKELDNKVDEYHARMEQNAKRNKKMERKMDHPMYSDPSYFGHRKKPKIRPVGKKKFCKECGIKH